MGINGLVGSEGLINACGMSLLSTPQASPPFTLFHITRTACNIVQGGWLRLVAVHILLAGGLCVVFCVCVPVLYTYAYMFP